MPLVSTGISEYGRNPSPAPPSRGSSRRSPVFKDDPVQDDPMPGPTVPGPSEAPRRDKEKLIPDFNTPDLNPDDGSTEPPTDDNKDKKSVTTTEEMEDSGCGANCPPEKNTSKNEPPAVETTSVDMQGKGISTQSEESAFSLAGMSTPQIVLLVLVILGLYTYS